MWEWEDALVEEEAGKNESTKGIDQEHLGKKMEGAGEGLVQDVSAYTENLTTETDVT